VFCRALGGVGRLVVNYVSNCKCLYVLALFTALISLLLLA
jgi:hypothetical protein